MASEIKFEDELNFESSDVPLLAEFRPRDECEMSKIVQGADVSEGISFTASDGFQLKGNLYRSLEPRVAILISAGTGFPRQFYADMAIYLARLGAVVMTYDYRGIGGSAAADIVTSNIDYPDWGRFDLTAAIDTLQKAAPGLPITHLAHSVGGHFIGLAPNHKKINRHAFLSVGTGYVGGHHLRNIPLELYFWWGMGAYSLWRHGCIANVGGWKGEPLPPKLFCTWRRWSHRRAYFKPDLGKTEAMTPHFYNDVTAPIRSWVFPDDPIATKSTVQDLLECYPSAPHEIVFRSPADIGVRRIGHEGAVRLGREKLWSEVWEWLSDV